MHSAIGRWGVLSLGSLLFALLFVALLATSQWQHGEEPIWALYSLGFWGATIIALGSGLAQVAATPRALLAYMPLAMAVALATISYLLRYLIWG